MLEFISIVLKVIGLIGCLISSVRIGLGITVDPINKNNFLILALSAVFVLVSTGIELLI